MSHSLQIFLHKTGNGINEFNNFPILWFRSKKAAHEFVTKLKSCPVGDISGGYFALNNPQHLPSIVRTLHMHPQVNSEDANKPIIRMRMRDGFFSIEDAGNIQLLKQCTIINNTNEPSGFKEYIDQL